MQAHNPKKHFALTPCQLLLWRSQSASPSCPLFNQVVTVNLAESSSPVNDAHLWAQAWTQVQQRHPVLTARIGTTNDEEIAHQWASGEISVLDTVALQSNAGASADVFDHWIEQRKGRVLSPGAAMTDAAYLYADDRAMIYLNLHHLISDAQSTIIIWQALQAFYEQLNNAEDESRAASTPVVNAPGFFDYLSETRWAEDDVTTPAITQRTAQEIAPVSFYQSSNNEPDTRSTRVSLPMTNNERQQFTNLNIGDNTTPLSPALHQMGLHLTALAIYLHRATGDHNIVIEVPLAGRFGKRWLDVAGNFIEMMQVKLTIYSGDTIAQVYHKANDALFSALKQTKPGCSANLPTQNVHGVLNVITASIHSQTPTLDAIDNQITWHHTGHSDMRHPLRLHVADWNATGVPNIELDINHGFFDEDLRARLPKHLTALYKAMLTGETGQRVSTIVLTTSSELWSLNGHAAKQSTDLITDSLIQRINNIAEQHPDAIALTEPGRQINYKDMMRLTHNVQHHLQQHSIGKGHRVAVLMHRGLDLPIVLLGILASGATYIPIDSSQPPARVNAILASAEVDALVVNRTGLEYAASTTLLSSELLTDVHKRSPADKHTEPSPHDTAYIMYTSGSTGVPKGVVVSHGALMSYLSWAHDYYNLPEAISMPLFTSVGFDLTVTSLFLPWLCGGSLHVYPQSDETDALALFDVMQNSAINTVKLTPAHLALLLESDCRIASVKQLIVGGEDFKNSTAAAVQARASHPLNIVNEYGPTEATVGCITRVYSPSFDTGSVPIGLPITGMRAYLLDEHGQPQFEGVTGELFLAGNSLADGYWKDPELTNSAFITTPTIPEERLYRTGDLARIDNGELVYLGRKDTQVNINGYRVELSEIESAIMEHPDVSHCIVQLKSEQQVRLCNCCGLSSLSPDATIDESGTCTLCQSYALNEKRIASYFRSPDDLQELVRDIKAKRRGKYDAVVLLSGGKDSTYALCQLVDLGLSVYAFSLDNGYLSDHALANIDTVCERLGVDHHFARTQHMDAIFNDSLTRYSNVCHGCFKTIYNMAMAFAADHKIDTIFTGLSRGQLFETRLNNELFSDKTIPIKHIDNMVVAARVQYHAIKDAPNTLLNIETVNNGALPEAVSIVDFYRYWHVEMADMLAYLKSRIDWVRPPDTGRSTNCLINDVGIHVHKLERGFHNYSLPYSWDVRLGHKEREEALEELDDDIDNERVNSILEKIQYTVRTEPWQAAKATRVEALFTTIAPLEPSKLQLWLQEKLPAYMQPTVLAGVAQLPLNLHGKVDRKKAFEQSKTLPETTDQRVHVPLSASETQVAKIWAPYVATSTFHRDDNFFQLGGDSQAAIRCVMELRRQGYEVEPADLFKKPVLFRFAEFLDNAKRQLADKPAAAPEKFSHLSGEQREKLLRLLQRKSNSPAVKDA